MTQDVPTSTTKTVPPIRSWPAPDLTNAALFSREPAVCRAVRYLAATFVSRGAERIRNRTLQITDELVEALLRDGTSADFVERLIARLPLADTCDAVGVSPPARERMYERTRLPLLSSQGAEPSTNVFPLRDRSDFDRRPDPHVSSGYGPRLSVGALLVRPESKVLMGAAFDQSPGNRLPVPAVEAPRSKGAPARRPQAIATAWDTHDGPAT